MLKVHITNTNPNTPLLLEIFHKNCSINKIINKINFNIISIDINSKIKYKELPTPDFIFISSTCIKKEENYIFDRIIKIIKYFKSINKNLKWKIENFDKNMSGEGLFNWIKSKFLEIRPRILNDLLIQKGNQIVNKISVCRKPVLSIIQKALNILSFGSFKKNMEKLGYDNVFHLYMVLYLSDGSIWSLEKNQRVNVVKGPILGGDCQEIQYGKKTLNDFILTAENRNIPGFYRYDAFKDNCQKWIKDIMNSNDINNLDSFILQDVDTLVPSLLKRFAQGATDIAGVADYVIRGGSCDI